MSGPGAGRDVVDGIVDALHRVLVMASRRPRVRSSDAGLTAPQASALAYLHRAGESSPRRMAEVQGVSAPVVSRMLARLESEGLLERSPHPHDGRQTVVRLTAQGAAAVENDRSGRDARLRSRIEELSEEQAESLAEAVALLALLLQPETDDELLAGITGVHGQRP